MVNVSTTQKTREVNLEGNFVLLINSEGYYGTLAEIKEQIANYVESGGRVEDCSIGEYKSLKGVVIEAKRQVHVPSDEVNEDYETIDEEYEVRLGGRKYESFSQLYYATECIEKLLEDDPDLELEDDIQLIRIATFGCSYSAEAEIKTAIVIPPQVIDPPPIQTGGIDWESKPNMYLMQELQKIQNIIITRTQKSAESDLD